MSELFDPKAQTVRAVTKANELIEARRVSPLTLRERQIVAFMVAQINPYEDTDLGRHEYEFPFQEFMQIFAITDKNAPREYEKLARGLLSKPMLIPTPQGDWLAANWISEAKYIKKERKFLFRFPSSLGPYLVQLRGHYTRYRLANLIHFKHAYSEPLYELLKQYERLRERRLEVEALREMLGFKTADKRHEVPERYQHYANLREKVLEPALAEINEYSDLQVVMSEIKEGRKVAQLHFAITPNPGNRHVSNGVQLLRGVAADQHEEKTEEPPASSQAHQIMLQEHAPVTMDRLVARLINEFGFVAEEALSLVSLYERPRIEGNLDLALARQAVNLRKGKSTDLTRYARQAIQKDYVSGSPEEAATPASAAPLHTTPSTPTPSTPLQRREPRSVGTDKLQTFLDRAHSAWREERLRRWSEENQERVLEDFALDAADDARLQPLLELLQLHGSTHVLVRQGLRGWATGKYGLDAMCAKELFMAEHGYVIREEQGQRLLLRFGKKVEL